MDSLEGSGFRDSVVIAYNCVVGEKMACNPSSCFYMYSMQVFVTYHFHPIRWWHLRSNNVMTKDSRWIHAISPKPPFGASREHATFKYRPISYHLRFVTMLLGDSYANWQAKVLVLLLLVHCLEEFLDWLRSKLPLIKNAPQLLAMIVLLNGLRRIFEWSKVEFKPQGKVSCLTHQHNRQQTSCTAHSL